MADRDRFPMSELVARTGTPPATVHHYRRLGLLPAARREARNRFLYDERHVERLRLIRLLRERRSVPLAVIRRILPELLGLEEEQAFRPEMWERVVASHLGRGRRKPPAARLLDAAADAFARRGYAEVGVDEISKEAGMGKGSVYHHYRSKEELFLAVAEASAREVAAAFAEAVTDRADEEAAAAALARAMRPRGAVFLELLARGLQRRPGYQAAAAAVIRRLAGEVERRVEGSGTPVVHRALGAVAAGAGETTSAPLAGRTLPGG